MNNPVATERIVAALPAFSPASPLGYLKTYGPRADPVTTLTWGLTWLSVAVVLIVTALVVAGVLVKRSRASVSDLAPKTGPEGVRWITVGTGLTLVALAVSLAWTVAVMAKVNSPAARPALVVDVTGHEWWWEAAYEGPGAFATANEVHVPVGQPVMIRLRGADVIHSFWVPSLTGKTDTIPGRTNVAWLQADKAGVYRGQCTEYCGLQHAHMAFLVIAQPAAEFAAWRAAQAAPAATGAGEPEFVARCGKCHTVRGTGAHGAKGPDLTHLMSRATLGAGMLANTTGGLAGWIDNAQGLKPGAHMPPTLLPAGQLAAIRGYVETLK